MASLSLKVKRILQHLNLWSLFFMHSESDSLFVSFCSFVRDCATKMKKRRVHVRHCFKLSSYWNWEEEHWCWRVRHLRQGKRLSRIANVAEGEWKSFYFCWLLRQRRRGGLICLSRKADHSSSFHFYCFLFSQLRLYSAPAMYLTQKPMRG